MRRVLLVILLLIISHVSFCWGFYAHKKINHYAVFLLPPEMMVLYKPNINFLTEHAVDPDKRKGMIKDEGARHFIDIDHYGNYPFDSLPRKWSEAVKQYPEDTLKKYGLVPWYIERAFFALTEAFKAKDLKKILKNSADIGHYISDAHVPLHTNSNHNGQFTNQAGIHGLWESRIPELLSEKSFNFYLGSAHYITNTGNYIWSRVLESAAASDSVLLLEKKLSRSFPSYKKYAFEKRNKILVKQYSSAYTIAYNTMLNGMVERRMQQAIECVASFWMTAWIDAGQPDLRELAKQELSENDKKEFEKLNSYWKTHNFEGHEICE